MRLIPVIILMWFLLTVPALAGDAISPPCLMKPVHLKISIPNRGFKTLPGGNSNGLCGNTSVREWTRKTSGTVDLFVHAKGPEGSGRYWNVTVGVGSKELTKPTRGVCLTTSTVGWRTLQQYKKGLQWLDDLDGDGRAEFVVWDSFPLHGGSSMAEYAIVAWVYRFVSQNSLAIDWSLSHRLAQSIAKEYRSSPDATTSYPVRLRTEAAEALEQFADERCRIKDTNAR